MIDSFTVQHCEHVSQRSFEDVVAAFEAELGSVEDPAIIPREVAAATSQADFEARIRVYEGRTGFIRFLTNNHGAWMSRVGVEAKIRSYIIGTASRAPARLRSPFALSGHLRRETGSAVSGWPKAPAGAVIRCRTDFVE
jgi:hypothetical protein